MPRPGELNPIARFLARYNRTQLLWGAGTFFGVLVAIGLWDLYRDAPPPDVSDLQVDYTPRPAETSGLTLLTGLQAKLDALEKEPDLDMMLYPDEGEEIDWKAVGERLPGYRDVLAEFKGVLDAPHFDAPIPANTLTMPMEYASIAIDFANVLEVRARWHLHHNRPEPAWQDIQTSMLLGERLSGSPSTMIIGALVGHACMGLGIGVTDNHLLALAPDAAITRQRTDWLKMQLPTSEQAKQTMLMEFQYMQRAQPIIRVEVEKHFGPFAPFFHKPHAITRDYAAALREALDNLDRPSSEMDLTVTRKLRTTGSQVHIPRPLGLSLVYYNLYANLLKYVRRLQAHVETTRVGLALAGYANEHGGTLPETLEELVPTYISEIPADPINGKPLGYDRERRRVWAVGRDQIAQNGRTQEEWDDAGQPGNVQFDRVVIIPEPVQPPTRSP